MLVWLFWRCFLEPGPTALEQMTHEKVVVERIKIVVKASLELASALFLMQWTFENWWPWVYCFSMLGLCAIRTVLKEQLDMPTVGFMLAYMMQNFIANIIDYCVFKHTLGYYHADDSFVNMFSYKVW